MSIERLIEIFILNYGLISIFVIVGLEYANIPLPSEIVLPFIGIIAYKYNIDFINVLVVSTLGGVAGSLINYYLGFKFGKPLIDMIVNKFPKANKSVKSSYMWVKRYDKLSILISRLVPLARTVISIVAGVIKMNVCTFIVYSTIGIGIWNASLIFIGYVVGDNLDKIKLILERYSLFVIFVFVILILVCILNSLIRKKQLKEK